MSTLALAGWGIALDPQPSAHYGPGVLNLTRVVRPGEVQLAMLTNLFVSLDCLDVLERSGKVVRHGNLLLVLPERNGYRLTPAYRLLSTTDEQGWFMEGRVMTEEEITRLNGRIGPEGVFIDNASFQVQQGYIGVMQTEEVIEYRSVSSEMKLNQLEAIPDPQLTPEQHQALEALLIEEPEREFTPFPEISSHRPSILPDPSTTSPSSITAQAPESIPPPRTLAAPDMTASATPAAQTTPEQQLTTEEPSEAELLAQLLLEN